MKKAVWWLVVPMLCVGGCIRIDNRVRANVNEGYLEISAGDGEVSRAIRQLIEDRGWTNQSEGAHTASKSSVRTGFRFSTREGLQLPARHRAESSEAWIYARTGEGKIVHFDIAHASGQPVTVRVGVEEGARISKAEVVSDLARRLQPAARSRRDRSPLTIQIDSFAPSATDPNRYTAQWTARGNRFPPIEYLQVEIRDEKRHGRSYSVHLEDPAPWKALEEDATEGPIHIRFERPAGVMTLEGPSSSAKGTATFEPNAVYVAALTRIIETPPVANELLDLFFCPVNLDYARQMKQALKSDLMLQNLLMLANHHVSSEYVQGGRDAGYAFSVEQLVQLTNHHIPLETLRDFERAGYDFSVDQLIRIRNHHLEASDFTAFREAGYDCSIDAMIRVKNHHVPVEMVRTLHDAGFQYDLDEIIKLRNYHVTPADIIAFRQAGYPFSVDELIKAKNYHIEAESAARLKRMGYNFSLDDFIKLRNYHVPAEFIAQLHDPAYENLTAAELIDFHQKRISAETINKIRTAKKKTQP